MYSRISEKVARSVSIRDLMKESGEATNSDMVICPFHDDTHPSAKFYDDDDGITRLFCHGCRRQYTSFDYILLKGNNPSDYIDPSKIEEEQKLVEMDFSMFDGFKHEAFGMDAFLQRLIRI